MATEYANSTQMHANSMQIHVATSILLSCMIWAPIPGILVAMAMADKVDIRACFCAT